jgi:hypothetical protein
MQGFAGMVPPRPAAVLELVQGPAMKPLARVAPPPQPSANPNWVKARQRRCTQAELIAHRVTLI